MHEPILLEAIRGEYEDEYGNFIYGECENCRIFLHGDGNYLDFRGADINDSEIHMGDRCAFVLGEGTKFLGNGVYLSNGWNVELNIASGVDCSFGKITMFANSKMSIGESTTIWYNYDFVIETNSVCNIGKDCMFSSYVKIDTADAHTIFDTLTGENLNSNERDVFHSVVLDDHVWCGRDTMIIGNAHIGKGSIIGAKCLAKGEFPNNCVIAGVPGRIIAKNRSWSREYMAKDIQSCGNEYIALTNELK